MPVNREVTVKNMGNVTISLRMLRIEDFQISLNEERVLGLELTMKNLY